MKNAPYGKTNDNLARRTDNLLNYMEKARKLTEEPHCVDFLMLDGRVALQKAATVKTKQKQKTLLGIKMDKLNHLISKPFANGFCVLKYSKFKTYKNVCCCVTFDFIEFCSLVQ